MRLIPILLVLVAAFRASAAEYDHEELERRLHKFQGMRTGGMVLAGLGGAALLGGIILASNGEWKTETGANGQTQTNAQDGAAAGGLILIVAGVPSLITGVILASIGNSKVHRYQAMLEGVSLDLRPGHTGARYSYAF